MAAGQLLHAYAYEVAPKQATAFVGGAVPVSPELETALNTRFDRSKVAEGPMVTFQVDEDSASRAHPVRDAALKIAFATIATPDAVEALAGRLAAAMDQRSKPSLLMASVHAVAAPQHKRLLLWTFPQQEVFNLAVTGGRPTLEVMDAFTTESSLRKVAMVEGGNTPSGMLTARIRDFQATNAERAAADLWITNFLDARLQMSSKQGTRLLAAALRTAHTRTGEHLGAQEQINAAIMGLRVISPRRWSINAVAATYGLGETATDALVHGLGSEERTAMFDLDTDTFDKLIHYTRFTLANGVIVSAPFVDPDAPTGVQVFHEDGKRRLRAEGEIQEERVTKRG